MFSIAILSVGKLWLKWKKKIQEHTFGQNIFSAYLSTCDQITQDALECNLLMETHGEFLLTVYAHTHGLILPPLPTSGLFKGFGPHVTWHLSADNGIYSQLLSHSALKPPHTHQHTHISPTCMVTTQHNCKIDILTHIILTHHCLLYYCLCTSKVPGQVCFSIKALGQNVLHCILLCLIKHLKWLYMQIHHPPSLLTESPSFPLRCWCFLSWLWSCLASWGWWESSWVLFLWSFSLPLWALEWSSPSMWPW